MKLSRRALLTLAGLAGLGLAVPACRQMLMQILFSPGATPAPAPPPPANPFRAGGRSLVAMVRGDDVPRAVQRAVDLIGGLGKLQVRGARTLVKPNVVWGEPPPATTDFSVNDQQAQPVFLVTAPANDRLGRMLRGDILPALRRLVGPARRLTVVFDREGWSPALFAEILAAGFDLLTYRKGKSRRWPVQAFAAVTGTVAGREVTYTLAEKTVRLKNGLRLREVRRLTPTGHQTAVLTSRPDLAALELAARMFARWQQENFFRYLRHSFALDALVTYAAEPADRSRTVPNPERRRVRRQLAEVRRTLAAREQEYGAQARANPEGRRPTMRRFKIAHGRLGQTIRALEAQVARLRARLKRLPARVPIGEVQPPETVVRLAPEAKLLTDSIKLTAYRAETALVRLLGPHYARNEEDGRALLREVFTTPADLLPDKAAGVLRVRLHTLANPRSNRALAALCEPLTATETCFPGTNLRLVYEPPVLQA